jgi:hypothetical protein
MFTGGNGRSDLESLGLDGASRARYEAIDCGTKFRGVVVTSTVFWLLHVYVRVVGRELPGHVRWVAATRRAAGHELPILLASSPRLSSCLSPWPWMSWHQGVSARRGAGSTPAWCRIRATVLTPTV